MNDFFSTIIYSAANEDPRSELTALALTGDDTVLTITGSGARALDLLIDTPKKIISLDMNSKQTFLLQLKCSAYQHLSYPEFKRFMGLESCTQRLNVYKKLKKSLPTEAAHYWDGESDKITQGILYCGVWESYLLTLSSLTKFKKRTIKQLFSAPTLQAQQTIFEQQWDGFLWRQCLKVLNLRWFWKYILKEPAIELVDPSLHIGRYIHQRLAHVISHQTVSGNPFLNLIIFGKYNEGSLPLHLQAQHFEKIKASIDVIEPVTMALDSFLNTHPDTIDAFSISDFSSYANETQYQSVWRAIMVAAKNKARVCERFFLVKYQPEEIKGVNIVRNTALEAKLLQEDHAFIYTFNCARINK